MLQPFAQKVLTPTQRAHATYHWFTAGLSWARIPVRGEVPPLTPSAIVPGVVDGDSVSDVLVQHATRDKTTPGHLITESDWLLLIQHATPQACRQIADAAHQRRHTHKAAITERAIRKAAEAGDSNAMFNLGILLAEQGRDDHAEDWYRKAAETGHTSAMGNLAET